MRIGCLQFAPQVGEVQNNISRAEDVLAKADSDDLQNLDLLVLPEMALSGYNFKSSEHILPYLEPTASGASFQWARTTARKYDCTVAVGYPEKTEGTETPEHYNSLVVVDEKGETLANYSKSFLYYTDETWACEGKGFYSGKLGNLGKVAMGICMDINPYKFEAPFTAYEFASHVLKAKASLIILSTAWLTNDERTTFLSCPHQPDLATLTYWARRLEPILRTESLEETIVVIGNRCGIEDDATYAGTSTVMGIKNGEFSLYGILGRGEEQLLVVDTNKPPYAKFTLEPLEELLNGDSEPEIPPPEPTNGQEDRPPKETAPGEGNGYVDSPTLPPSGFLPFNARSHATPGASTLTDSATNKTEETYFPLPALTATPTTFLRPRLS
ncbi:hypothetical protein N0V88_001099 [Collariella sp. IMI 366227]|nr:hypothetical protein N0V88_001099 [Collariella sp. IMI 366227]